MIANHDVLTDRRRLRPGSEVAWGEYDRDPRPDPGPRHPRPPDRRTGSRAAYRPKRISDRAEHRMGHGPDPERGDQQGPAARHGPRQRNPDGGAVGPPIVIYGRPQAHRRTRSSPEAGLAASGRNPGRAYATFPGAGGPAVSGTESAPATDLLQLALVFGLRPRGFSMVEGRTGLEPREPAAHPGSPTAELRGAVLASASRSIRGGCGGGGRRRGAVRSGTGGASARDRT
jgi:hypothetical protein